MSDFKIPVRDLQFVRNEVLDFATLWQKYPACQEANQEIADTILEELAKFCDNEIAPLNRIGDEQGCTLLDSGEVKTPDGFKEAYQLFVESGWPGLASPTEIGGQGLPTSMAIMMNELLGSSNWSWSMYTLLSHGAKVSIEKHGSDVLKELYLPKMCDGSWTGTMCLTEPHCGTDLGLLRTKAEPQANGTYKLTGTKIFISSGEHDMAENIVHLVIARTPDAPEGTKGISLFLAPKFIPDASGKPGARNAVSCGSLEHKMGIHGNSTCVMNFDGAEGYLVGELNKGLNHMFTMMNSARLGVALQGIAHGERGLQGAASYAIERLQSRALSGPKNPTGIADPIVVHPDVRRMLLTIKSLTEGSRLLAHYIAQLLDVVDYSEDADEKKEADDLLAFLTPIAKGFMTEAGYESANLAQQVFGGHGYIAESGMEQNVRDARIAMIYEGTNGIQALDLLGRKVLSTQGELLKRFTKRVHKFCQAHEGNAELAEFIKPLAALNKEWGEITMQIGMRAMQNREEVSGAAMDYMMYSGYVSLAYSWAMAAEVAQRQMKSNASDAAFYQAKIQTAQFYYKRILPRTRALVETMKDSVDSLMAVAQEQISNVN